MIRNTARVRWACLLVLLLSAGAMAWAQEPRLDLVASFSLDGGKTWSADFPVMEKPGKFRLKVTWTNVRPAGEDEVFTTLLWSEQGDFASANVGKQDWRGKEAWYQRPMTYWADSKANSFEHELDFAARPAGRTGYGNVWDAKAGKFKDGPRGACPALADGTYKFTVSVGYRLKNVAPGGKTSVEATSDFFVTIGQKRPPTVTPAATVPQVKLSLDPQKIELVQADQELPASAAECFDASGTIPNPAKPASGLVTLHAGQEIRWIVKKPPAERCWLGVLLTPPDDCHRAPARLYVDGHAVNFTSTRVPGQVTMKGRPQWIGETLSAAVNIHEGSEVRLVVAQVVVDVGRVSLYASSPARGPVDVQPLARPAYDDRVRVTATMDLPFARQKKGVAAAKVVNALPQAMKVTLRARVLDYFQQERTSSKQSVMLEPRTPFTLELPFDRGQSDRYRMIVEVQADDGSLVSAVADKSDDGLDGGRGKIWLSGRQWEYAGAGEATTLQYEPQSSARGPKLPADAQWISATVPGRNPGNGKEHCGWFRCTFTVPDWLPGPRRVLHMDRVCYEGVVYLNGKKVASHMGWHGAFEVDVTDVLQAGENELLAGVRDGVAALTEEEQAKGGSLNGQPKVEWPGADARIVMGDAWLLGLPKSQVRDVTVETSFRKKTLTVRVATADLPPGKLTLKNTVYFEGKKVLVLPDKPITAATMAISQEWPTPVLWGPGQPNLLRLDTEIVDEQDKSVDLVRTRFGFREMWAQDARLYFNGVPTNFRAYAMNDDWGWTDRMQMADIRSRVRSGLHYLGTMERHIYASSSHFEVADEEGMPVVCGVSGEAGPTQFKLESDVLWRHTEQLAVERIGQLRNHPCIVEWYLSNEYSECASDAVLATRRLVALRDACAQADATRIFEAGCDLDLRGALDITCTHYPVDVGGLRDQDAFLPDAAMWHLRGQPLVKGMHVPAGQVKRVANVHGESPLTWGEKPLIINETGWNSFYAPLFGYTILLGDDTYRSPTAAGEAHMQANEWFMAGHRDAQASVITPWHHHFSGAIERTLRPLDIFPFTRTAVWYSRTEVTWNVDVFHDTGRGEKLRLRWELTGQALPATSGTLPEVSYEPYGLSRQEVKFTAPQVDRDQPCELRLSLLDEKGNEVAAKSFAAKVAAPGHLNLAASLRLGLIDPAGKTQAALERLGVKTSPVRQLLAIELAKFDALIIGEGAMSDPAVAKGAKELHDFLEAGGKLLCLHQEKFLPEVLPQLGRPVKGQVSSIAWARAPHHPILASIDALDLRFWFPDHVVARDGLPKPAADQTLTIIDAGNTTVGLDLSLLMETQVGKGRAIISQLMFAAHAGACPPADKLVLAMLDYLVKPVAPVKPCALLTKAGSPLDGSLKLLQADLQPFTVKEIGAYQAVIVDADSLADTATSQSLKQYLQGGGKVLLHGATPAHKAPLRELAGGDISVVTATPPNFDGRAILDFSDPLTDGLSNQDFFWRRQPETEDQNAPYFAKDFLVDQPLAYAYQGKNVRRLCYPAGLVAVSVGKGTLYLDGLRWDSAAGEVKAQSQRIAVTLLRNLGVSFRTRQARQMLRGLDYRMIDISQYFNRALADEVAGDGKGGWTDQGPDSDLRMLPTGKGRFADVPFEIATHNSCLVLASRYSRPGAPKAVEGIKIAQKADALYFLQSSAYTGRGLHAKYIIHFADGQTREIALDGNVNYRDWAATDADAPFPFETNTLTQVGWSGKGKHFGKVSVYVMEWVNPRPDVEIASFDFVSTENAIPVLLGVTTGVKGAGDDAPLVKGDGAAAKALDDQAKAAADKGDRAAAQQLSREALAKDATYLPAHVRLADLLEQAGDTEAALKELYRVVRIDPQHLETYLRIGAIYERQKQWQKAMEIYRLSLQANPNQPPVMQAMDRVKKAIETNR